MGKVVMDEKPIHVRVAEALCDWCSDRAVWPNDDGSGHVRHPGGDDIPRYDLDWSATGPLVEKYKILVAPRDPDRDDPDKWLAASGFSGDYGDFWIDSGLDYVEEGKTPLLAICNLILALHKAGKLKEAA